jgi:hypothetical protein
MNIMGLLDRVALGLKTLADPHHRNFFLQRRIKDIPARERRADAVAARLPGISASAAPPDAAKAQILEEQGLVPVPGLVVPEWLGEMVGYFSEQKCGDPYRPRLGTFKASEAPAGTHVAYFSNEVVGRAPHVFEIANDASVINIVSGMLGAKPTISYMTAWWSLPAGDGTAQHAERFHRDVDDWRFVKLFCYLTDVDETAGPHVFVRGSHKINKLTEIRRFSDEEVSSAFGKGRIVRITGPAGTCFLENTYGIHRGVPPMKAPRLIFQVLYSLRQSIYGPSAPVAKIGMRGISSDLDPYVNRIYCAPG